MPDADSDRPLDLGRLHAAVHALAKAVDVISSVEFRELRNITAHTYARDKALKVAAGVTPLLARARVLLSAIEARNHG